MNLMNANVLRRDKQRNERIRSGQVFDFQKQKITEDLRMNPRGLMMNSTVMMTKMTQTRTQSLVVVTQIRTSPEQPLLVRMRGKSTMHCQRAM